MSIEKSANGNGAKTREKRLRRIKVVLRRLPHSMTETDLIKQLDPMPASVCQRWFSSADTELLPFAFSRAYFVFEDETDAITFCDRFNGYVFVDKLGNESIAIAEQAPFPEIPKKEGREQDKRMNTLESDSEYLKFLANYNSMVVKKVTDFDGLLKEIEDKHRAGNLVKSTPLTEYVERHTAAKLDRRIGGHGTARGRSDKSNGRSSIAAQPTSSMVRGGSGLNKAKGRGTICRNMESNTPATDDKLRGGRNNARTPNDPAARSEPFEDRDLPRRRERKRGGKPRPEPPIGKDVAPPAVRRGMRFSDRAAHQRHQQKQTVEQKDPVETTVSSKPVHENDINENRRRRERRRGATRGDKSGSVSGSKGNDRGVAVVILRSLKAERQSSAATKEASLTT